MKISKIFGIDKASRELDFLDVDTDYDTQIYIDPNKILYFPEYEGMRQYIGRYWKKTTEYIHSGDDKKLKTLRSNLGEPNETCLGMSRGKPEGKSVGIEKTLKILEEIKSSKAVITGKVQDLQDITLFVDNVGPDNVSDITTNLIKYGLIKYTQEQCKIHGIPSRKGYATIWRNGETRIKEKNIELPYDENNSKYLIFVPKKITSHSTYFSNERIYAWCIIPDEIKYHIQRNDDLVDKRKNGERYCTAKKVRKNLKDRYLKRKNIINKMLEKYPNAIIDYKRKLFERFKKEFKDKSYLKYINKLDI